MYIVRGCDSRIRKSHKSRSVPDVGLIVARNKHAPAKMKDKTVSRKEYRPRHRPPSLTVPSGPRRPIEAPCCVACLVVARYAPAGSCPRVLVVFPKSTKPRSVSSKWNGEAYVRCIFENVPGKKQCAPSTGSHKIRRSHVRMPSLVVPIAWCSFHDPYAGEKHEPASTSDARDLQRPCRMISPVHLRMSSELPHKPYRNVPATNPAI
ncbi:uncharacterized protein EV422DRAFT_288096 [Fimicolochytrium jonesii]|uniref:uncharacterized protein n=1 Tax=Fimicolochytrium jonesii TaxID=1396493 RepID=UPI0022FEB2A7|nr:uncharacterized protein EV422DRAFT_288096 [Fimicolochytrium jonesii]KAI8816535.1 hypothetical protein EV422DRAFT_288096 [Fimicolochytrium jonesii]